MVSSRASVTYASGHSRPRRASSAQDGRSETIPITCSLRRRWFSQRAQPVELICPTGCLRKFLSSPSPKNISLRGLLKSPLLIPPSRLEQRGVSRSSRTWSAGCGGRRRRADECAGLRTAKSCGPDAPTLASSCAEVSARRWWQKSPVTRESAKETVKTTAQGRPDDSG
jgi:hypothetical protein